MIPIGPETIGVAASPDGKNLYVTQGLADTAAASGTGKLVVLDRRKAESKTGSPVVTTANGGTRLVVANSNRDGISGSVSSLAVVDVPKALAGQRSALLGVIKSGATPRQFAVEPGGKTLLVTNTGSGQVEAVNLAHLP